MIEELPDPPKGVDPHHIEPGQDPLLDVLVEKHRNHAPAQLFQVPDADWREHKDEILAEIKKKTTGFEGDFYDVRNTFVDDAMECFRQHARPAEGCSDWYADSKKLTRPTPEGQRWQRENFKAPTVHLCDFCPVRSWVESQVNLANPAYQ